MRVWVTRTEPGGSRLATALEAAGHTVWLHPTLDIECLATPLPPGAFALTVFLSEHAVAGAFANGWTPGPAIAIGAATGAALSRRGVAPRIPAAATTEGIIDMLTETLPCTTKQAGDDRVLIAAGEGGRDTLVTWLAQSGHRAVKWPLYRRVPQRGAVPADTAIEAIVVGSIAGLQAMAKLWFASKRSMAIAVVVPSRRVANAARTLGFTRVLTAAGADAAATLAALRQTSSEERS